MNRAIVTSVLRLIQKYINVIFEHAKTLITAGQFPIVSSQSEVPNRQFRVPVKE
jgi:hypothetical protein